MLTLEECKKHIGKLNLPDHEIEKIRGLLYAFVERTLDYSVETGMLVGAETICQTNRKEPQLP